MSEFWSELVAGSPWSWFIAVPLGLLLLGLLVSLAGAIWESIESVIDPIDAHDRRIALWFLGSLVFVGSIVAGAVGMTVTA